MTFLYVIQTGFCFKKSVLTFRITWKHFTCVCKLVFIIKEHVLVKEETYSLHNIYDKKNRLFHTMPVVSSMIINTTVYHQQFTCYVMIFSLLTFINKKKARTKGSKVRIFQTVTSKVRTRAYVDWPFFKSMCGLV